MLRSSCLVMLVLVGCDRPSPLGKLTHDDVHAWASDCEVPIVEEAPSDPHGPGTVGRDGHEAFSRATHRFRCPPPGWVIYTDNASNVVGLCVDDDTRSAKNGGAWLSARERARRVISAHWGKELATDMLSGTSGDNCSFATEHAPRGMLRWGDDQLDTRSPETTYSHFSCCWEISD